MVNLWVHQNNLLWSRLQTLTALQLPMLGGWYYFYFRGKSDANTALALLVASLGVFLSLLIRELAGCDASRRRYLLEKVQELDPKPDGIEIFPDEQSTDEDEESTGKNKETILGTILAGIRTGEKWVMGMIFHDRLHKSGKKRIRGLWVMQRILGFFCVVDLVLAVIAFVRFW